MDVAWTAHAEMVALERGIRRAWVERVLKAAELVVETADGTRHYLGHIPERDGRVLRVIVNPATDPPTLVTTFFDRRMKGRVP